jgi:hypothetical protein
MGGGTVSQREKVDEARKALRCLYIAVEEDVARDVEEKVEAALSLMGGEPVAEVVHNPKWGHIWWLRKPETITPGSRLFLAPPEREWKHDCDHWKAEGIACRKCNPIAVALDASPAGERERDREDLSDKPPTFSDKPERDREAIVEAVATYLEAPYPKNQFGPVGDDEYDSVDGNLRSRMHAAWARHWANVIRENKDAILGGGE